MTALETLPMFLTPHEPIFRYYAVRALGRLGDVRALPLLEYIRAHETQVVLKGKSIGDMAEKAIGHISKRKTMPPSALE